MPAELQTSCQKGSEQTMVLKNILAVGMGLGQGRLDGLPPNVLWEVSCIWFVFVFFV